MDIWMEISLLVFLGLALGLFTWLSKSVSDMVSLTVHLGREMQRLAAFFLPEDETDT